MKVVICAILLVLVQSKAHAQQNLITWNRSVKIAWSDFKGKAEVKSPFAAMSGVGIYYKYNSINTGNIYKIRFTIDSRFDRTSSWSKKRMQTAAMLRHEQLHFDIAEVVSRAFRKEAEHTVYGEDHKDRISKIFNKYTLFLQKLQQKYDLQTMHSNNKVKQKEWERSIDQELKR